MITGDPNLTATITVSGWSSGKDSLAVADAGFSKLYPNVTIQYVSQSQKDYQLDIAAGKGLPDVAMLGDGGELASFAKLNALVDLTDRLQPWLAANAFVASKLPTAQYNGRYYGMPWDVAPMAVYYNREVFAQAGVDPLSIKTWDDYLAAAKTIKAKTGVAMVALARAQFAPGDDLFVPMLGQQNLSFVDSAGAISLDKDPKTLAILEYLGKLWDAGVTLDVSRWTDAWYKDLADGKLATEPDAVWEAADLETSLGDKGKGKWGVMPLPVWDAESAPTAPLFGTDLVVFNQGTPEQQQAAWYYIEYHLGDVAAQVAIAKTGSLPSLVATYSDPYFLQANPWFNNQQVLKLFTDLALKSPTTYPPQLIDYYEIRSVIDPELQKYATGQVTAAQALSAAAAAARTQTGRP